MLKALKFQISIYDKVHEFNDFDCPYSKNGVVKFRGIDYNIESNH